MNQQINEEAERYVKANYGGCNDHTRAYVNDTFIDACNYALSLDRWVERESQKPPVQEGYAEEFETAQVGLGVTAITEHSAAGEGDKWHYDIWYADGSCKRVFNPNTVIFDPPITNLTH